MFHGCDHIYGPNNMQLIGEGKEEMHVCLGSLHFLFWVNIACRESRKTFDDVHEILVSAKRKAVVALDRLYSEFCNECKQQTSNIKHQTSSVICMQFLFWRDINHPHICL